MGYNPPPMTKKDELREKIINERDKLKDNFDRLTEQYKECARLYHAHTYQYDTMLAVLDIVGDPDA